MSDQARNAELIRFYHHTLMLADVTSLWERGIVVFPWRPVRVENVVGS